MSIQEFTQRTRPQCSLPAWTCSCYFLNGKPGFDLYIETHQCFGLWLFFVKKYLSLLICCFLSRKLLKLYLSFITKAQKMLSSSISSYTSLASSKKKINKINHLLVAMLFRTLSSNSLPLVISQSPERKQVNPLI